MNKNTFKKLARNRHQLMQAVGWERWQLLFLPPRLSVRGGAGWPDTYQTGTHASPPEFARMMRQWKTTLGL